MTDRKRSDPAVSHSYHAQDQNRVEASDCQLTPTASAFNGKGLTCNLTVLSPIRSVRELNSTPIVWAECSLTVEKKAVRMNEQ